LLVGLFGMSGRGPSFWTCVHSSAVKMSWPPGGVPESPPQAPRPMAVAEVRMKAATRVIMSHLPNVSHQSSRSRQRVTMGLYRNPRIDCNRIVGYPIMHVVIAHGFLRIAVFAELRTGRPGAALRHRLLCAGGGRSGWRLSGRFGDARAARERGQVL